MTSFTVDDVFFQGKNYFIYDVVSYDESSLFLYNYNHNQVIWFRNIGYWECYPEMSSDFLIRNPNSSDTNHRAVQHFSIKQSHFVTLLYKDVSHVIECEEVLFWDIGSKDRIPNKLLWYQHKNWKPLWRLGEILNRVFD